MNSDPANRSSRPGSRTLGVVLVGLGALFLLGQLVDFGSLIGSWGWPFFIIVPGVLLLAWAFAGGRGAAGLAIPGSVVTTVGVILFFQNLTGRFESWAYAWGLIVAAAGIGRFAQGVLTDHEPGKSQGWQTAVTGTLLFAGFGVFFELFVFNDSALARYLIPLALIGAGAYLLMRRPAAGSPQVLYKETEPKPPAE